MRCKRSASGRVSIALGAVVALLSSGADVRGGIVHIKLYGNFGLGQQIEGVFVEDLISADSFPDDPGVDSANPREFIPVKPLSSLEWPQPFAQGNNNGQKYGSMAEGYVEPPEDGAYRFFIRSDDGSRLELSTDHMKENAETIARVPGDACCSGFLDDGIRSSAPIRLNKGKQYYFRVLHKEGTDGDWWQVAWSGPGIGEEPRVVDGTFLQSFVADPATPEITRRPQDATVAENADVTLGLGIEASPPVAYQWQRNGAVIDGATSSFLRLEDVKLREDGDEFTVEVSNPVGSVISEEAGVLMVTPDMTAPVLTGVEPSLVDPNLLTVAFSERVERVSATDTSHYRINQDVNVESAATRADGRNVVLMASGIEAGEGGYELTVSEIVDRSAAENKMSETIVPIALFPTDYRETVLRDHPDIYYSVDETGGVTASNLGGLRGSADGNYIGALMLGEPGPLASDFKGFEASNKAPRFQDAAFVRVQNSRGLLNGLSAFTISAWIRPDELTSNRVGLFGQNDVMEVGFKDADTIQLWTGGTGRLRVEYPFDFKEWHHIAAVGSADGVRLFLDGVEVGADDPPTGSFGSSRFPVRIGGGGIFDEHGNQFTGQIDEVAIWRGRALPPARIESHFEAALDPAPGEPLPGAEIQVNQQPQDQTVSERQQATFSIDAIALSEGEEVATKAIHWLNGAEEMVGRGAELTTPPVTHEDDQSEFFAVVRMPGARVMSERATLTVDSDISPPAVSEAKSNRSLDGVTVVFDEAVTRTSAENSNHYSIVKVEDGSRLTVEGATLSNDDVSVVLETAKQEDETAYRVSVMGVEDTAVTPNMAEDQAEFFSWARRRGGITQLVYTDIEGRFLEDFYTEPRGQGTFPPNPRPFGKGSSFSKVLSKAEIPVNVMNNYGAILTGWLIPPETGEYVFYMSADHNGELYLSSDNDPSGAELVASDPGRHGSRNWIGIDRRDPDDPQNISDPIRLEAGQRYYLEASVKDGVGSDNLGITWQRPGEAPPENGDAPISGEFLETIAPPTDHAQVFKQEPDVPRADDMASVRLRLWDPTVPGLAIDPSSVIMTINGQPVEAQVSKDDEVNTTDVTFTPSEPYGSFSAPNVVLEFKKGDQLARVDLSFQVALDPTATFVPGTRFIEHEDYNYEEGQWVDGINGGATGQPYDGGALQGLEGVNGIDFNNTGASGRHRYRPSPGPATSDFNSPVTKRDRGTFLVDNTWKMDFTHGGEWYNYTRVFPQQETTYHVFAHIASRPEGPVATLQRVTSDPTLSEQSTEDLGRFSGPATGEQGRAFFYRMHEVGNSEAPATVTLSGVNTLRWLEGPGDQEANFMAFVPLGTESQEGSEVSITRGEGAVRVEWSEGILQTAPSVNGPWMESGQGSPATFSVEQNGGLFMRTVQ